MLQAREHIVIARGMFKGTQGSKPTLTMCGMQIQYVAKYMALYQSVKTKS